MSDVSSFPPLSGPNAQILVLGSMPGKASLEANQYYAHPRNAFWSIMESVFAIERRLPYSERCDRLVNQGVAVWDVLRHCHRPGSLDADIDPSSIVVNDFHGFLTQHPHIGRICFNGATAEKVFQRNVSASLTAFAHIDFVRLPSTSPAHASLSIKDKIARWRPYLRVD